MLSAIFLCIIMLNVVMLSVIMLSGNNISAGILNVVMLSATVLIVIILNVVRPNAAMLTVIILSVIILGFLECHGTLQGTNRQTEKVTCIPEKLSVELLINSTLWPRLKTFINVSQNIWVQRKHQSHKALDFVIYTAD
jgi:hypothetical protein